jgi:hypothetical protein
MKLRYWRARLRLAGRVNRLGHRDLAIRIHPAYSRAYTDRPAR